MKRKSPLYDQTVRTRTRPNPALRWFTYLILACVLSFVLLVLAVFAARSWLLPDLTILQPRIEAALSTTLKQPVRIHGASVQWGWTSAAIKVAQLSIGPFEAPTLQAKNISATVLAHPLLWGAVQTSGEGLNIEALTVLLKQTGTVQTPKWLAAGYDISTPSNGDGMRWLLAQPSVKLAAVNVVATDSAKHWLPEGRKTIALMDVVLNAAGLGGYEHRAGARFAPAFDDPSLGRGAHIEAQFTHAMLSDAAAFKHWSGQAMLNLPNAHIARSLAWALPLLSVIDTNQTKQWQQWAKDKVVDARLNSAITVQFDAGQINAKGKLSVNGLPEQYANAFAPLQWSWKPTPAIKLRQRSAQSPRFATTPALDHRIQVGSDSLSLAPLALLLNGAPLSAAVLDAITQAKPQGTLNSVLMQAQIDEHGIQQASVQAKVKDLGAQSIQIAGKKGTVIVPTIEGLAGSIKIKHDRAQTHTHIELDTQKASLELPRLFSDSRIDFDDLSGQIDIKLTPQLLIFNLDKIRFSNVDAAGQISGQYTVNVPPSPAAQDATEAAIAQKTDKTLGLAKITGEFSRADLGRLHRYMPLTMSSNARDWLRHTIAKGQAKNLQLVLNGELTRFPFLPEIAQAGERFDLRADLLQGVLNFNPLKTQLQTQTQAPTQALTQAQPQKGWPLIEQVAGELQLNGLALTLTKMQGNAIVASPSSADSIALQVPKLTIASLTQPVVVFQARATAPAQSVLALARSSPLLEQWGEQLEALKATGNVSIDTQLSLDIAQPERILKQGTIQTDQLGLQITPDLPAAHNINASITFKQNTFRINQASAFWLGSVVQASGVLDTQDPSQVLKIQGTALLNEIKQYSPHAMAKALLAHADGAVDYELEIFSQAQAWAWSVKADLKNAAVLWPGLVDKPQGVSLPLSLSRSPIQRTMLTPNRSEQMISEDLWQASLGASLLGPFKATVERRLQDRGTTNHVKKPQEIEGAKTDKSTNQGSASGTDSGLGMDTGVGGGWRIVRGAVALGDTAQLNAPDQGLGIHIATPYVNLDQLRSQLEALPWQSLPSEKRNDALNKKLSKQANDKLSNKPNDQDSVEPIPQWMPSVLALQVDDLLVSNRHFYDLVGAAVRDIDVGVQEHRWSANLVAKGINGYVSWVDTGNKKGFGGGSVLAKLTELTIPDSEVKSASKSLLGLAPEQVPSLDISIEKLTLGKQALGQVIFKASNIAAVESNVDSNVGSNIDGSISNKISSAVGSTVDSTHRGWNIDTFTLTMPHVALTATGQWLQAAQALDGDGHVSVQLAVKTDSLGDALDGFGYGKLIAGAPGILEAELSWRGTPFAIDLPSLSGTLKADFDKGQFLKIDPGAGKLIGLFSLQNLPRRLTLDFKDAFGPGFGFNSMDATARISQGVLKTDDFLMSSSLAQVSAKGEVSLVSETQTLTFTVKPDFNAGSVSLLYMIINPPIGLATLIAQYVLKEPISKALTLEYAITGSWVKPDVQQIKREFQ